MSTKAPTSSGISPRRLPYSILIWATVVPSGLQTGTPCAEPWHAQGSLCEQTRATRATQHAARGKDAEGESPSHSAPASGKDAERDARRGGGERRRPGTHRPPPSTTTARRGEAAKATRAGAVNSLFVCLSYAMMAEPGVWGFGVRGSGGRLRTRDRAFKFLTSSSWSKTPTGRRHGRTLSKARSHGTWLEDTMKKITTQQFERTRCREVMAAHQGKPRSVGHNTPPRNTRTYARKYAARTYTSQQRCTNVTNSWRVNRPHLAAVGAVVQGGPRGALVRGQRRRFPRAALPGSRDQHCGQHEEPHDGEKRLTPFRLTVLLGKTKA